MVSIHLWTRRILVLSLGIWVAGGGELAPLLYAAPPPKKAESHGEAGVRTVIPGEKMRVALLELGSQRMAAGRYDEALKAFGDVVA